jgi:hypothetical protein
VSGAQPQPRAQQDAGRQPEAQPQPHRPPQAYPAPPVNPPTVGGAPAPGPSANGPVGHAQGAAPAPGVSVGPGVDPVTDTGTGGGVRTSAVRRSRTGARTVPRTRKARLRVAKADPWSVMKVSFLLSIALGVCTIVAVAVLWMVMNAMGVFSAISGTVSQATESGEVGGFDLESFLSLPRVLLFTSVIAVIDVVLATALATLGAFVYNLSAGFVGGVEVTLAEDE